MWRHYDVIYVKTVKNSKIGFSTTKILGTSDFHRVWRESFSEWIVQCIKDILG